MVWPCRAVCTHPTCSVKCRINRRDPEDPDTRPRGPRGRPQVSKGFFIVWERHFRDVSSPNQYLGKSYQADAGTLAKVSIREKFTIAILRLLLGHSTLRR